MKAVKKKLDFFRNEVFLIPSGKEYLLYAPTLRMLLRITKGLALKLSNHGIRECKDDDISYVYKLLNHELPNAVEPFDFNSIKPKIFPLSLGLTKECTLNCLYCHANAGVKETISRDVIEAALNHAFETSKREGYTSVGLSFTVGGEPTSNWELFTFCVDKARNYEKQYGIDLHLSMTTNGYYGDEKRKYIAENFNSILLSLDGTPDIQNYQRPAIDEGDSYLIAKESGLFFKEKLKSFAIRATVSNINVHRLPEIVKYFADDFGTDYDLLFEPLNPLGRANENVELIQEPDARDFIKYFIDAKKVGRELGMNILTSCVSKQDRLVTSNCGSMAFPSLTITTKGMVTSCGRDMDAVNFWYGKYSNDDSNFIIDDFKVSTIREYAKMQEKCEDCFCKWHCAGDCPDARRYTNRCFLIKSLTQNELEELTS